jgi:hypothetical protein
MNVPFALNLYLAGHVPPTELAIIITTAPFLQLPDRLADRLGKVRPARLLAIAAGFTSTLVLILRAKAW